MTVALAGCEGSGQIVFTGPPGFTTYQWQGPYCPTCPTPPPIYTGQTVTITTAQGAVTGNIFHLNVTAANGCTVSNIAQVVGFTSVTAAFTPAVNCAQNVSTFTDNSTSSNTTQPIINRKWQFEAGGPWTDLQTTATYSYTYASPGTYAVTLISFSQDGCSDTLTQNITVSPAPAFVSPVTNDTICSGASLNINFTFNPGDNATWTSVVNSGTATIVKSPASQSGTAIHDQIFNTGTTDAIIKYDVTPHNGTCTGTHLTIFVVVKPTPHLTSTSAAPVCSPGTFSKNLASDVTGTTFTWSATCLPSGAVSGFTATQTTGVTSIGDNLTNNTPDPATVTYVITPHAAGCTGPDSTVTVTVNPRAVITSDGTVNWCSDVANTYVATSSSTTPAPSYSWTRTAVAGVTPATGSGTSATITETLSNSNTDPVTVVYAITPTVNSCPGTTKNVNVTLNPKAVITSPSTANWCNNVSNTYTITSSSTTPAPTYTWSRAAVAGITNPAANGTGNSITETLENTTPDPIQVQYVITPTVNGCNGIQKTVTVTVNPTSTLTSPDNAYWCSSVPNTYTMTSSSTSPAPSYSWTRAVVPGISNAAGSGTGSSITETLVNTTLDPVQVHYVITPAVNGCGGNPFTVTVTVNPIAVITSASTANWCNDQSTTYNITSSSTTPAPSYTWSRAAVAGITPATASGTGDAITETLHNSTVNPIHVSYVITPSVNGCTGQQKTVDVTVNPTAVIISPTDVNWCTGIPNTYTIVSSSTAPVPSFSWTRDAVPGISNPAASGTGSTITETLNNTTSDPVMIHYVITPTVNGCNGTTKTINVTVNPSAIITSATNINWCSDVPNAYTIGSSSINPPPSYNWSRSAVAGITPATASGTGNNITETLHNSTPNPIQVTYGVTPIVNGCNGNLQNILVTVNPIAVITSPDAVNWCNDVSNTYNITSSSTTPTPDYSWSRAAVPGITNAAASGTGATITETLHNSTPDPITVYYEITPTVNSCAGTTKTVAVTVNPTSAITSPATANWCTDVSNAYNIMSSSTTPVPAYTWSRAAVAGITPANASGTGATITETLQNSTTEPIVVTYTIIPSVNSCNGTTKNVQVTVNPNSVITSASGANYCNDVQYTYNITSSSTTPVPTYTWSRAAAAGITPATISGTGDAITETLHNSTTNPIVVQYSITPTVNTCAGTLKTVNVTVNPTVLITSPTDVNWCTSVSNTYTIASATSPAPTYAWTRAAVPGITNPAAGGTGNTITETLENTTTDPVVVHYVITPTINSCNGTIKTVNVTVNPKPVITSPGTANWCTDVSNTYNITSSSTTPAPSYTWSRAAVAGISNPANGGTGDAITETLYNTTVNPVLVTYVITPTVNACNGDNKTVTVTVNPKPVITSADAVNWCNDVSNTYSITSSSTTPVPSYAWSRAAVAGITNPAANGTGATITETLHNSTNDPVTVQYVIVPSVNGCNGVTKTVTVTVNPTSVITSPSTANWCDTIAATYTITSSSATPVPSYTWSRAAVPGITPATASGTGATIAETLNNTTTNPVVVTYAISPTVNSCPGTSKNIQVTVNPTAVITSPATANWGNNILSTYNITSSTLPTPDYSWTRAAVAGISNPAASGTGAVIQEALENTTTDPIIVHYLITPTVNGCTGFTFDVAVTVNPTSAITSPLQIYWCNNVSNTYTITSSTTPTPDYTWSRAAVPGITNTAASGTGATITETLVNSTYNPVHATYAITPYVNGFPGTPAYVDVTVQPTPDLSNPAPSPICSETTFNINLTSHVQNCDFSWTATCNPVGSVTGFTATQPGYVTSISDPVTNTINTTATVTYMITPRANSCYGQPTPLPVNVRPKPVISCTAAQTICSGTAITPVNLTSTVSGTDYSWSATCPVGSVTPCPVTPGTSNPIPATPFANSTDTQQSITYTITSSYLTCPGTSTTHTVTVNPVAKVTNFPMEQTICSGNTSNAVALTSNVTGATFAWTASTSSPITGFTPGGTSTIPAQTLLIPPGNTGAVTYSILPTYTNGPSCPGTAKDYKINVNPLPTPSISGSAIVCELQPTVVYTTPSVAGHSYLWTVTGATDVQNANTNSVTVTWGPYTFSPGTLTVKETIDATGCPQTTPVYSVTLMQRPVPTLTGPQTVCDQSSGKVYQTESGMSNYQWTISGGTITGGGATGSPTATVTWNTPGSQWIQVNYINALGCPGYPAKQLPVTVNSLPDVTISEGTGPNCESASHSYSVPANAQCSYAWSILPSSAGMITTGQGSNLVNIDWQAFGNVTLAVTGTNNTTTCLASSTHGLTVHPKPLPVFTPCFDLTTTSGAKKFTLRGASPLLSTQGVFSGTRVSYNAVTGKYEFDPYGAPAGIYAITYTYTNNYGCISSAGPVNIAVLNNSFSCGGKLTDPRDGRQYNTATIGARCWMTQNLAYGTEIDAHTLPQTDNCIVEKYCLMSDANCTAYGGLYQWDEVMRYGATSANQGICPPEWHVPSESEFQSLLVYITTGLPNPPDALSGSFMKDMLLTPGFYGLLDGLYYTNNTWSFTSGTLTSTMFWTSGTSGSNRGLARGLNNHNPSVSRYYGNRENAFSVRCVKDTP